MFQSSSYRILNDENFLPGIIIVHLNIFFRLLTVLLNKNNNKLITNDSYSGFIFVDFLITEKNYY